MILFAYVGHIEASVLKLYSFITSSNILVICSEKQCFYQWMVFRFCGEQSIILSSKENICEQICNIVAGATLCACVQKPQHE